MSALIPAAMVALAGVAAAVAGNGMGDNQAQAEFWTAAQAWVDLQDAMDIGFAPVLELVMARAGLRAGDHVLDIGCGTGASLIEAAKRVDINGRVQGLDISATLLDVAAARCRDFPHVSTRLADAQSAPMDASFDAVISRFGVMFFDDTTAAFANIRKALKPGATFTLAAWGPAPQNPWFMVPAKTAREVIGAPPKVDRTLPGPFAFEDASRVTRLLSAAGLSDVTVECVNLDLTPHGSAADFADLALQIGPAQSIANHFDADTALRDTLRAALTEAMQQFETPQGLRVPAAIHLITAKA